MIDGRELLKPPLPESLPDGWELVAEAEDGAGYRYRTSLTVIVSAAVERDGRRWLHVSVAARNRLPTWQEYRLVKDLFVGREVYALSVLPPADRYINLHPYCLHLFACLDGWPLPEFSAELDGLRTL